MGPTEDETALRDAVLLVAAGDDPGPAGRVFSVDKRLPARGPGLSSKLVAELADLLGLAWDERLATAVDLADAARQSGRPDAEVMADVLIAAALKWSFPAFADDRTLWTGVPDDRGQGTGSPPFVASGRFG